MLNISNDIEVQIKKIISDKLNIPINKINSHSSLVSDLGIDSLGFIEIAFEVEDRFKVNNIPREDLTNLKTVKDVADYIGLRLKDFKIRS